MNDRAKNPGTLSSIKIYFVPFLIVPKRCVVSVAATSFFEPSKMKNENKLELLNAVLNSREVEYGYRYKDLKPIEEEALIRTMGIGMYTESGNFRVGTPVIVDTGDLKNLIGVITSFHSIPMGIVNVDLKIFGQIHRKQFLTHQLRRNWE